MTQYPGGKNSTFRNIINQIPPHDIYLEPFVGSGAVLLNKQPAPLYSVAIDQDGFALNQIMAKPIKETPFTSMHMNIDPYVNMMGMKRYKDKALLMHMGDALYWASQYADMIRANNPSARVFAYWDPPYLMETRSSQEPMYRYEFATEEQHRDLLQLIKTLPWMHAISGYKSELYKRELESWREITWEAVNRAGNMATEHLWMNYEQPYELHDYRYLGKGFRDREKIRRQQKRWDRKLKNMPALQRYAMMSVIEQNRPGAEG